MDAYIHVQSNIPESGGLYVENSTKFSSIFFFCSSIFCLNLSCLFKNKMIETFLNHRLFHMLSNRFRDSCNRFCNERCTYMFYIKYQAEHAGNRFSMLTVELSSLMTILKLLQATMNMMAVTSVGIGM